MQKLYSFCFLSNVFSTQTHCYLTFSWIELQTLLRCCLIHVSIVIPKHFLYLVDLCSCLGLDLFMYFARLSYTFSVKERKEKVSTLNKERYNTVSKYILTIFVPFSGGHESMSDVCRVVDCYTNWQYQYNCRHCVDSQFPKMHITHQVELFQKIN